MARPGKLAGAIISFLLSTARLRVQRKVHVLASKLVYGLELAKLARYSAGFSPRGRLNFLFLHSMHVSEFLPSIERLPQQQHLWGLQRSCWQPSSKTPGHHKYLTDNLPCGLHTQPSPAQILPHGHHLLSTAPGSSCTQAGQLHRVCSWEVKTPSWKTSSCGDLPL